MRSQVPLTQAKCRAPHPSMEQCPPSHHAGLDKPQSRHLLETRKTIKDITPASHTLHRHLSLTRAPDNVFMRRVLEHPM